MLSTQNCYLLSRVVVVQKPCTKKVEPVQPVVSNQPMTMEEALAKFTVHEYIQNKF